MRLHQKIIYKNEEFEIIEFLQNGDAIIGDKFDRLVVSPIELSEVPKKGKK